VSNKLPRYWTACREIESRSASLQTGIVSRVSLRTMPVQRVEERWAAQILSSALTGVIVSQYDNNRQPEMHDLSLHFANGMTGAAEVTSAVHSRAIELWRLATRQPLTDDRLKLRWTVGITPDARFRRLKAQLPALLLTFEAAGRTRLFDTRILLQASLPIPTCLES
jgi:hypothetical protein